MHSIDVDRLHALERALHAQIPLTRAMDVRVLGFNQNGLTLGAALTPNLNHKMTAFGGSLNSLATLACWGLVQLLCLSEQRRSITVIIQESHVQFLRPVTQDFEAICPLPPPPVIETFMHVLERRGRARIELEASILAHEQIALRFRGLFVTYDPERFPMFAADSANPRSA